MTFESAIKQFDDLRTENASLHVLIDMACAATGSESAKTPANVLPGAIARLKVERDFAERRAELAIREIAALKAELVLARSANESLARQLGLPMAGTGPEFSAAEQRAAEIPNAVPRAGLRITITVEDAP